MKKNKKTGGKNAENDLMSKAAPFKVVRLARGGLVRVRRRRRSSGSGYGRQLLGERERRRERGRRGKDKDGTHGFYNTATVN